MIPILPVEPLVATGQPRGRAIEWQAAQRASRPVLRERAQVRTTRAPTAEQVAAFHEFVPQRKVLGLCDAGLLQRE